MGHLESLVGFDTSDPVPTVTADHAIIAYAAGVLEAAGCVVTVEDLGGGCVNLLAVRGDGSPAILFNNHLDTVHVDPGWQRDPFSLTIEDGLAFGLGTCDIKGAAACLLAAVETTDEPVAVLLTTDEEGGKGTCIEHFIRTRSFDPEVVVVAEPTRCEAVAQHRGFASFEVTFQGSAGHTSAPDATAGSAIHMAVRWADQALSLAESELADSRFNIGVMQGGTASNVVSSTAKMRFGFRPAPGADAMERGRRVLRVLKDLLPNGASGWTDRFLAPPLTASETALEAIKRWGIDRGPDVDFWTEAALFEAGGLPAVVIGPGDIAQAHTADEFVEIAQLERGVDTYTRIIREGVASDEKPFQKRGAACAP